MIRLHTFAQVLDKTELENTLPPESLAGGDPVGKALQLVFAIAGAVSLIIIMIGAFQYVTSAGNPQAVNKAKDTILYAIIGLVICILAYAIVGFVVNSL